MITFKEFGITGLFGETDVNFSILDNRLIIVGYNGIGKSTILNIFYYFISQQWHKLGEQDFTKASIKLKNNNRKLTINRTELLEYLDTRRRDRYRSKYGLHNNKALLREAISLISRQTKQSSSQNVHGISKPNLRADIGILREELGLPMRAAEELAREVHLLRRGGGDAIPQENIGRVDEYLSENLQGRILYLPTYRRIEKDIKTVFPEIEEELQSKLARRRRESSQNESYIELVQFGMEDVKENIASHLQKVRIFAFGQINSLTTKYLRDVIRDEANQYEEILASQISEAALSAVFSKVDSALLSDKDKDKLTKVVEKMRSGSDLLDNEKYVAHYVFYLAEVGNNIAEFEKPIVQFVSVCNSYLYGKSFNFDNISYQVKIVHDSGRPVEMEELSSGEKQIVSLFSHLILDQKLLNYIFIDEPELSLSVDWQQRFLEDISNLSTCAFIGAVTHSPFIYENSLEAHTIDLLEHMTPSQ